MEPSFSLVCAGALLDCHCLVGISAKIAIQCENLSVPCGRRCRIFAPNARFWSLTKSFSFGCSDVQGTSQYHMKCQTGAVAVPRWFESSKIFSHWLTRAMPARTTHWHGDGLPEPTHQHFRPGSHHASTRPSRSKRSYVGFCCLWLFTSFFRIWATITWIVFRRTWIMWRRWLFSTWAAISEEFSEGLCYSARLIKWSRCSIESVPTQVFLNLTGLMHLDLSSNKLGKFLYTLSRNCYYSSLLAKDISDCHEDSAFVQKAPHSFWDTV